MWIEFIGIKNLRCVRSARTAVSPGLVWIRGPNGAGKTTLLEAIYLLDRGRTFRGRHSGPLTTRGEEDTSIWGNVVVGAGGRRHRLGWSSDGSGTRLEGTQLTRYVGASSFSLVEGGPDLRRRFFDWSLFHVEPECRELWSSMFRLQRQRNSWLRSGAKGPPVWDEPYASQLDEIWRRRCVFLERFREVFSPLLLQFFQSDEVRLKWSWSGQGLPMIDSLRRNIETDRRRGFTFLSSSRGDVQFLIGNSQWRGSRGENKLVGILLQLSVQQMALAGQANSPVVLLDDPYAELSGRHIEPLLEAWMQVSEQVFVTSLDDVPGAELRRRHPATFHVEQGALTGL